MITVCAVVTVPAENKTGRDGLHVLPKCVTFIYPGMSEFFCSIQNGWLVKNFALCQVILHCWSRLSSSAEEMKWSHPKGHRRE